MKWYELAKKLGWSSGYLSKVLHGYGRPSAYMAHKAAPVLRRKAEWWEDATQSEIQKVLEQARRRAA